MNVTWELGWSVLGFLVVFGRYQKSGWNIIYLESYFFLGWRKNPDIGPRSWQSGKLSPLAASRIANAGQSWPWEWKALQGKLWEKLSKWWKLEGKKSDTMMIWCFLVRFCCWKFYPSNLWDGFLGCFWSFFRAVDVANKTPGCSREKSFSVRPGLLRGNRGSNPVNERVPVFLPLKTMMTGGMGSKVSMIHGSNSPGIFALPESLTSLGVTSATLSFNILTAENSWQIPKSCLLTRYGTIVKYSKIFHLQKWKLPSSQPSHARPDCFSERSSRIPFAFLTWILTSPGDMLVFRGVPYMKTRIFTAIKMSHISHPCRSVHIWHPVFSMGWMSVTGRKDLGMILPIFYGICLSR